MNGGYILNYVIFLVMWFPCIYFLSLHWKSKNFKFYLSLAYAIGLLTYRLNRNDWSLYNANNFISCFGIAALFVCLAVILIYYFRKSEI